MLASDTLVLDAKQRNCEYSAKHSSTIKKINNKEKTYTHNLFKVCWKLQ